MVMAKRIWRSLAIGALLEIILMVLASVGAMPDSFQWLFTPTLFIASLLRIGSHDGGIIVVALVVGTMIFAALILAFDLILIPSKRPARPEP